MGMRNLLIRMGRLNKTTRTQGDVDFKLKSVIYTLVQRLREGILNNSLSIRNQI
jgi:hypothetical protein